MAAPPKQQQAKLIFYHIPGDGDDAESPNAYPVLKPNGIPTVREVRSKFPLPGKYHFRFKMKWGEGSSSIVWMDVPNEDAAVPMFDGKIIAKVIRISWDGGAATSSSAPRAAPAGVPAAAPAAPVQAQPPAPAPAATRPPAPQPQNMLSFDDDFGSASAPARPAAPPVSSPLVSDDPLGFGAPAKPAGKKDDFDMLFS
jgi:hypothetical protein